MNEEINLLTEILQNSNNIVFFGGAGVSTASGIPDFRSSNGLYSKKLNRNFTPEQAVSHSFFVRYPEEFFDFYKKNLLTELELESFKNSVKKTSKWCEDNNIKYLFVIGPNKHSVYPENYIDKRPEGTTRADQLISVFNELGITCVYPRDYLIAQKEKNNSPLYYETDTHWNNLGAYYAFTQIENEVKKLFPNIQFPKVDYDFEVSYSENAGDILPMLGIKKSKSTQIVAKPKNSEFSDYFEYIKNEGTGGVITKGKNENLPRAIVFRDSFFSALTPYFSTMFSSVEYNWRRMNEEDKKSILENKPDLIVFENVERYAVGIAGM